MKKMIKKAGALFFCLALFLFFHTLLPRFVIEMNNPVLKTGRTLFRPAPEHSPTQDMLTTFMGFEGVDITANIKEPADGNRRGSILLIHGIAGNYRHYDVVVPKLNALGFQTIAVNLRSHGSSTGNFCTYGVKEKHDLKLVIDSLQSSGLCSDNLGIWGHSLGGAVSLQALAQEERLQFGIVESTFSDFLTILKAYQEDYIGFEFEAMANYLSQRACSLADFTAEAASPKNIAGEIKQPILLVHGDADMKIDVEHASINFEALGSPDKRLHIEAGAGHDNLWQVGGEAYWDLVSGFILEQVPESLAKVPTSEG